MKKESIGPAVLLVVFVCACVLVVMHTVACVDYAKGFPAVVQGEVTWADGHRQDVTFDVRVKMRRDGAVLILGGKSRVKQGWTSGGSGTDE